MKKIFLLLMTIISFPGRIFTKISPFAIIKDCKIDKKSAISMGCKIYNCQIGKYSYVGKNTVMINTSVGKFSSIGYECIINPGSHPIDMGSTSPVFYKKNNILKTSFGIKDFDEYKKVNIGNDVWIGARVLIKGGISIGDGAIIGACSVVTKDVPPYTIYGGNPARIIKKRFDDTVSEKLCEIKWWDWDENYLLNNLEIINEPSLVVNYKKKEQK